MFLGQAISHLDQFAQLYVSQWAMVGAITAALRGEAAAWAADLYSDHARELGSAGLFLDALHGRFDDPTRAQRAEADLLALQQGKRPAIEYVREFRKLAGRLQSSWPERMLVHQFRAGLDHDLRQACVYRGVPNRLRDWFRVVIELEAGLKEVYRGYGDVSRLRRPGDRPREGSQDQQRPTPKPPGPSGAAGFRCFRCDQPGHRAADCPAPSPRKAAAVGRATPLKKATESSRAVGQQPTPGVKPGSPTTPMPIAGVRYQPGDEEDSPDEGMMFVRSLGSSQALSSAYHPSTNGAAERANAMVERYLRSYVSFQQTDWVDLLPFAEVAYNNTVHSSTGYTPFKIVYGMEFNPMPELSPEVASGQTPQTWQSKISGLWDRVRVARRKAEAAAKVQADKKRAEHKPFKVGDWVYLATKYLRLQVPCKKLGPKYVGPFQILKVVNPVTVQLRLPASLGKVHPVFHSSLLKPTHRSPYADGAPGPISGSHYEVQEVLDSRKRYGKTQYLLRWKGYPLSDATWVGEGDIKAPNLIRTFHRKHPDKLGRNKCNVVYSTPFLSSPGGRVVQGAACQAPTACHKDRDRGSTNVNSPGRETAEPCTATPHRRTGRTPSGRTSPREARQTPTPPDGTAGAPKSHLRANGNVPRRESGGLSPSHQDIRQGEIGGGQQGRRSDARTAGRGGGASSGKGTAQGTGVAFIHLERMLVWDGGRSCRVEHADILRWREIGPSADFVSHA
ncbi:uncharacterized protein LOC120313890 [Crotalus tigris]|uniref:uncharacterized protein LOC120313890 n=1 Tax=Crotalus tigris TaxID=88082 RepID=UPI00192F25B8|nr:uncharacterized protein LOC120313890 [Crotalus tigris]